MTIKLEATSDDLDVLWDAVHQARRTSEKVTVNKNALINILHDFSVTYDVISKDNRYTIIEAPLKIEEEVPQKKQKKKRREHNA